MRHYRGRAIKRQRRGHECSNVSGNAAAMNAAMPLQLMRQCRAQTRDNASSRTKKMTRIMFGYILIYNLQDIRGAWVLKISSTVSNISAAILHHLVRLN